MFLVDETTGDIELVQGDSGTLYVDGIPDDKNYKVYFSIYNSNGKILGDEVWVYSYNLPTVTFEIPSTLTDLLTVKGSIDDTAEYYYGVKVCDEESGFEDTLLIGNKDIGELNIMTVHRKTTEGTV